MGLPGSACSRARDAGRGQHELVHVLAVLGRLSRSCRPALPCKQHVALLAFISKTLLAPAVCSPSTSQRITLERPLPYPIAPDVNRAAFYHRAATTEEVGVEGLTFSFKWELYAGHHLVSLVPFVPCLACCCCWGVAQGKRGWRASLGSCAPRTT